MASQCFAACSPPRQSAAWLFVSGRPARTADGQRQSALQAPRCSRPGEAGRTTSGSTRASTEATDPRRREAPSIRRGRRVLMTELPTHTRKELARRSGDGLDVTLIWVQSDGEDKAVICVCDRREGSYFEIPTERYLALEVYYHPFAYRNFSTGDYEDSRTAA